MLKIIISPAKKMNEDTDSLEITGMPHFLCETENILTALKKMNRSQLKNLWGCNDKIADLNLERITNMDLTKSLTPAILSYEGLQYKHMAPSVFDTNQFEYISRHLNILSGFYGVLKPFDGIRPYRLEMQAKLEVGAEKNLYDFWSDKIYNHISQSCDTIVNLASEEYSRCISRYKDEKVKYITCIFGQLICEKVVEKGTMCKMARGEMVRFMAENSIENVEEMKEFTSLGYEFSQRLSDKNSYIFLKK